MTTNTIAKHYGVLSADERFSLLVAAAARGDDVEVGRIDAASPRKTYRVADTYSRSVALLYTALTHRAELLDLAARFFLTTGFAAVRDADRNHEAGDRIHEAAKLTGYLFRVNDEAWGLFCRDLQLTADFYELGLPGGTVILRARQLAEHIPGPAYTEADALEYVQRGEPATMSVWTAERVAQDLRAVFVKARELTE